MITPTNTTNTKSVLIHHLRAVGRKDLGAVLADYDESSVIYSPDGPITGLKNIRSFFNEFFRDMPSDWKQNFRLQRQDIRGDTAYIVWRVISHIAMGTDTFIIRGGKIKIQTYAMNPQA